MAETFPKTNKTETSNFEGEYCNNPKLEEKIKIIVTALEQGLTDEQLEQLRIKKMIKATPTFILKANNKEGTPKRYQPGNQLVTYIDEFDKNSNPKIEAGDYATANIKKDSVILSNGPIYYPKGHKYEGQQVKGFYDENGYFTVDQKNGTDLLNNEYVSDINFVKNAYGVDAKPTWEKGYKLDPSYLIQINNPDETGLIGKNKIRLETGGYIAIDTKKGKVVSVHAISKTDLEKTYMDYTTYTTEKNKNA